MTRPDPNSAAFGVLRGYLEDLVDSAESATEEQVLEATTLLYKTGHALFAKIVEGKVAR